MFLHYLGNINLMLDRTYPPHIVQPHTTKGIGICSSYKEQIIRTKKITYLCYLFISESNTFPRFMLGKQTLWTANIRKLYATKGVTGKYSRNVFPFFFNRNWLMELKRSNGRHLHLASTEDDRGHIHIKCTDRNNTLISISGREVPSYIYISLMQVHHLGMKDYFIIK